MRALSAVGALAGLSLTSAVGVLPAASAQAANLATCPVPVLSQPFLRFGDANYYSLIPDGGFESLPLEWTLLGGAGRGLGGDPYDLTGKVSLWSLSLPTSAVAQSPSMCVEPSDRTFRFMARSEGAPATVRVQLVYHTLTGLLLSAGTVVSLNTAWEPSPILHTGAALATAITGETAYLSLRFTTLTGHARIDDVFLDPRRR
jgi:hypothetical protein